ncbi:HAMP domain-containing sensor histidine kinase [Chengkuizengella axinellae]|uniref:histidine kinase n=1 Tax=Chengkuizengella axinellae TaxID=3064388 RepID=A0ABT9IX49_9BACL|nr:HAMP domain-containing sensor histidine kinase [Chengkuizengella sp. 2205SS18-9]MDP5273938.1 HAMP domain-containing sensor histidine kinase [Chengkuizengella sp. 2205SS18-9]
MLTNSKNKQVPLLKYWTLRYFLILLCILILITMFFGFWIKYSTIQRELKISENTASTIALNLINDDMDVNKNVMLQLDRLFRGNYQIYDISGEIISSGKFKNNFPRIPLRNNGGIIEEQVTEKIKLNQFSGDFYLIVTPIISNEQILGYLSITIPEQVLLGDEQNAQYHILIIIFICLSITGWLIIYWLLKKLTNPIRLAAEAAVQVSEGNYDIKLNKDFKEKELYELNYSFENMAARLKTLETLRTELLAGITHEIKTPVTSISGLVQAVKDKVVTKEEEEEFLHLALQESNRLQKMVEDLLDFNSYAAGVIHLDTKKVNLNTVVHEVAKQWKVMDGDVSITLSLPEEEIFSFGDSLRMKQILFNLLKNSQAAMTEMKEIIIKVYPYDGQFVAIDIQDSGSGIPKQEQPNVFERFFRGSDKKDTVRGLGLGLSLSKILATAQKGDLILKESSPQGTTFTLLLPALDD